MGSPVRPGRAFGQQVRAVRRFRGLTQQELADRLPGISVSAIRKIERNTEGRGDGATIDDLLSIAAALNVAPVHLLAPFEDEAQVVLGTGDVVGAGRLRLWIRGGWPLREGDDRSEFARMIPSSEFEELMLRAARRRPDEPTPAPEAHLPGVDVLDQALDHRDDRWTLEQHREREEDHE